MATSLQRIFARALIILVYYYYDGILLLVSRPNLRQYYVKFNKQWRKRTA